MTQPIAQVDAFTATAFAGNPAAVCVLAEPRDDAWMQLVAAEMNLAETAFVRARPGGADAGFDLRWFTPAAEVDLCGHATLATAHLLWEEDRLAPGAQARFHTRSGLLTADRRDGLIELDFPSTPDEPTPTPDGLVAALGATPISVAKSRFDYLVELENEAAVRLLAPDFKGLARVGMRGVIATARAGRSDVDFVSRFFAPALGIDEDPVTGSAHCCLGPFWGRRLGRTTFLAHQLSKRGGVVRVRLEGDRVKLGGQAVTVLRGALLV